MTDHLYQYDVFLSHNSRDKDAVRWLAERLEDEAGLTVFLDIWNLIPGEPWQEDLEQALAGSETIAVFLGPAGISSWHNKEMRDALNRQASDRSRRVIPVLLPGADLDAAEVPSFLSQLTWVDFRSGLENQDSLHRLIAGISGTPPGRGPGKTPPRRPAPAPPPKPEPEKPQQTSGGIHIGSISGISGSEINIAGRDVRKSVQTIGGDQNILDPGAPVRDIAEAFADIYARVAQRPEDPNVDREEIRETVEKIEQEIKKGEDLREPALTRWLRNLNNMAPDILDVTAAVLAGPLKGATVVVQKIAERARQMNE